METGVKVKESKIHLYNIWAAADLNVRHHLPVGLKLVFILPLQLVSTCRGSASGRAEGELWRPFNTFEYISLGKWNILVKQRGVKGEWFQVIRLYFRWYKLTDNSVPFILFYTWLSFHFPALILHIFSKSTLNDGKYGPEQFDNKVMDGWRI